MISKSQVPLLQYLRKLFPARAIGIASSPSVVGLAVVDENGFSD
jgi:hypothetical protein